MRPLKAALLSALLGTFGLTYSQSGVTSRVKVSFDALHTYDQLCHTGVCGEGALITKSYIINDLSQSEISLLQKLNFNIQVLIPNVSDFYATQNTGPNNILAKTPGNNCDPNPNEVIQTPENYTNGSMGGYFTYNEMLAHLDNMRDKYPNLISDKTAVPAIVTYEGRPIYFLKITQNPDQLHIGRSRVLYTALHRANAPGSLSQMIFYMYYLLENYNKDPEIKAILDNTELYFVPCVNPDGYVYNNTTNPGGGGMWSKNRRPFFWGALTQNNADSVGVDLLSNYGYNFGFDEYGSSNDITYRNYRGPFAFSEPETNAIKLLMETHQFNMVINHRAPGHHIVFPWGYSNEKPNPNAKASMFEMMANILTENNFKRTGNNKALFNRPVNGNPEDWFLGAKNVLCFAPSMGVTGTYYSPEDQIISQCKDNLILNINAAKLCRMMGCVNTEAAALSPLKPDMSVYLPYTLTNAGLDSSGSFKVTIEPVTHAIVDKTPNKSRTHNFSRYGETIRDSFQVIFNDGTYKGEPFVYVLKVDNGKYIHADTFSVMITNAQNDHVLGSASSFDASFKQVTGWGNETYNYRSLPASISDSPLGNYADNDDNALELASELDLMYAEQGNKCVLSFYAYWDIEPDYDYAQVQASIDTGKTWFPLCGRYTKPGSDKQDEGNPVYDGKNKQWVREELDLAPCIGHKTRIRFRMVSDIGISADGMYIDDIRVSSTENHTVGVSPQHLNTAWFKTVPNPASQSAELYYNIPDIQAGAKIQVTDMLGKTISEYCIDAVSGSVHLDLSNMPSGMYFCRLLHGNAIAPVQKLIKY